MDQTHFNALKSFANSELDRLTRTIGTGGVDADRLAGVKEAIEARSVGTGGIRNTSGPVQSAPVLGRDIQALGSAINELDDALCAIGQAIAPVSAGEPHQPEELSLPPPSSEVSSAVIEATRRVLTIAQRARIMRDQIRL